jgi:excisionase family DNA binding protein
MSDDVLNVFEVATLLRVNPQTVRNWIDAGSLPAVRLGRRVCVRREDLESVVGTADLSPENLLTVAEVAKLLKLNPQTIRNAIDGGRLTAVRLGRRVRIRRSDLEAYFERVEPKADRS